MLLDRSLTAAARTIREFRHRSLNEYGQLAGGHVIGNTRPGCRSTIGIRGSSFVDSVERPLSTPPPQGQRALAIIAAQSRCGFRQQTKDHRAIIVGKIDQTGLGDQPAELDQLPGSFAPLHLPVAPITTGAG